jgi:hypothetical protein
VWDQVQQKLVQINFKCDLNNKKEASDYKRMHWRRGSVLLANLWRAAHAAAAQRAGGAAAL